MSPTKDVQMTETVFVRMTPALRDAVQEAADQSGLVFSEWVRAVLARAVAEGAYQLKPKRGSKKGA